MSYKKGFTLVELLGVFVILSIIVLVTFPYATGLLKNTKDSEYKRFEKNLFLAAEAYIEANSSNYEELKINGRLTYISLADLTEEGFVSEKMTNPKTKTEIDLNNSIKVTKTENGLLYELLSEDYSLNGYVQNGLILHYDGYKAPYKLENDYYWKDMSGNQNDGILNNDNNTILYKNNGYEFTNNSDYIESKNNLNLIGDTNYTVEVIFKSYGLQSNQTMSGIFWFGNPAAVVGGSSSLMLNKSYTSFSVMNLSVRQAKDLIDNNIHAITVTKKSGTFNTTNAKICINNNCNNNGLSATESSVNLLDSKIQIGRTWQWNNDNRTLNGVVYSVRIYNRVLTQSEITKNYKLDQKRYGI